MTPFPKKPAPVVKGGLRPPVTWSYSVLTGFEACPHRHHAVKVARTHAERVSDANAPGQDAHRAFERRIAKATPLPPDLSRYETLLGHLAGTSRVVKAEARIGLDHALKSVGFFAPSVWCRVVVDVLADRGASAVAAVPDAKVAAAMFVYTNHDVKHRYAVRREEMSQVMDEFAPRIARLEYAFAHNDWPKTPSWACRYCPVTECGHNKTHT